ncbi:MAG: hypothetical protein GPJ54_21785 [Candidatus Heimdallarchaeota archaeon]|nr:hypothetical protein [Candidatus Heimdallarchaeota archaeon]
MRDWRSREEIPEDIMQDIESELNILDYTSKAKERALSALLQAVLNNFPIEIHPISFPRIPFNSIERLGIRKLNLYEDSLFDKDGKIIPGLIEKLKQLQLKFLALNFNEENIPSQFGELKSLTNLQIIQSRDGENTIPEEIWDLTGLKYLKIFGKHRYISEKIGNLESLENLDLSSNQISILPESICNLVKLEYLNLGYNEIIKLPKNIGELKSLSWIFADWYMINLPTSFSNLNLEKVAISIDEDDHEISSKKLEMLIEYNPPSYLQTKFSSIYLNCLDLNIFPPFISKLSNLKSLDIDGTSIKILPDEIVQLKSLNDLRVNWHKFQFPENVKYLDIRELDLTEAIVEGGSFDESCGNFSQLEKLRLNNCYLFEVPIFISKLINLKVLDLTNNNIIEIPNFLKNLEKLEKLLLGGNRITEIPGWLRDLPKLKEIDI